MTKTGKVIIAGLEFNGPVPPRPDQAANGPVLPGLFFAPKESPGLWRVEGAHDEAKTQHGLRRAVRCGLANVAIQSYLTSAVMNLNRLAALLRLFLPLLTSDRTSSAAGEHFGRT